MFTVRRFLVDTRLIFPNSDYEIEYYYITKILTLIIKEMLSLFELVALSFRAILIRVILRNKQFLHNFYYFVRTYGTRTVLQLVRTNCSSIHTELLWLFVSFRNLKNWWSYHIRLGKTIAWTLRYSRNLFYENCKTYWRLGYTNLLKSFVASFAKSITD